MAVAAPSPEFGASASRFSASMTEAEHYPIIALMPPNRETRISEMRPVARAIEEAEFYAEEGAAEAAAGKRKNASEDVVEASVVTDGELVADALELMARDGKVSVSFQCECSLPFLVLQLKDIGRFCSIEVTAESRGGEEHTLVYSSRATLARVGRTKATMPLMLSSGWNYLCLDVEDALHLAFGASLAVTTCVTVRSSCRLARVFFQDKRYEDRELPDFLRVLQ